ncbi:hypothetical protein BJY52DRAFT_1312948 [Lactarius psammicola]|nr:hypothetical protein BJY52DRAFT_1312948 [Lactarius psammicola]
MPLTTHTARHGEMTIPMTDSNPPLINRVEDRVRCGQGNICTSVATSGCTPVSQMPDGCAEERCLVSPLELEPSAPPFGSASTVSRFMDRLGANAPSLSSLRTIPSWRSSLFPDVNKTYAKIHLRHSSEESDTPNPPHLRGARPHHPSIGSLQHRYLRHRRQNRRLMKQNSGHDPLHTSVPPSNFLERFSHSTMRRHDDTSSGSSSSLSTRPSSSSDSHFPSPSTSEESYPSPYSADALAVFHSPTGKRGAFFKGRRRHENNRVQVIFEEATDATSTSAGVSSAAHSLATRGGRISRLKRRIRTLAESISPPRPKAPTTFNHERRSPHLDDYDSEDYDIPCLAYISCIW